MNARIETKMNLKKRAAVLLTAAGIMLSMGSGVALAANIQGGDKTDDVLIGTVKNDTIKGYGRDDVLKGLTGSDTLYGGGNKDQLFGNESRDVLVGGAGDDHLVGGEGNDRIQGARDAGDLDRISCGAGANDTAIIDQFDRLVDNSCENVKVVEFVPANGGGEGAGAVN